MAACPNGCLRTFRRCATLLALGLGLLALASSPLPMPAWEAALGAGAMSLAFAAAVYRLVLTPLLDSRGQRTEDAASLLRQQAELDALQSQINPHFLYNTLDSIRGQALAEGAEDIANMTEALSTFFRYSISNRSNVVTLEEELEKTERQPESPVKFTRMGKLRMQLSLNKNKLEQFDRDMEEQREEQENPGVRRLTCGVAYPGASVTIGPASYRFQRETRPVNASLVSGEISVI